MTEVGAASVHATCVAIEGAGVLIRSPAGAGKSDLALRLIDGGAVLVADDRVALEDHEGFIRARAPARLRGRLRAAGARPRAAGPGRRRGLRAALHPAPRGSRPGGSFTPDPAPPEI